MTETVNGLYFLLKLLKLFTDTFFLFILRNIDQEAQTVRFLNSSIFSPVRTRFFFLNEPSKTRHMC